MYDYRFKQMEFTMPQEYRQESELEQQRRIEDRRYNREFPTALADYIERAKDEGRDRIVGDRP